MLAGQSPADVARMLASHRVDVIGVNCGVGPQSTLDAVSQMALPLFAAPLGHAERWCAQSPRRPLPLLLHMPEYFGEYTRHFVGAGVRLIGGCCGTTPAHVAAMRQALAEGAADTSPMIAFSAPGSMAPPATTPSRPP